LCVVWLLFYWLFIYLLCLRLLFSLTFCFIVTVCGCFVFFGVCFSVSGSVVIACGLLAFDFGVFGCCVVVVRIGICFVCLLLFVLLA